MKQPIGPEVDAAPAVRPGPATLTGRYCRVEKLDARRHGADLWRAYQGDDWLWRYFPAGPFPQERGFADWIDERAAMSDPYSYAVIDLSRGRAGGILAYLEIRPDMRVIEVGGVIYGRTLQETIAATEAQYLMARHAFETLGYRRYEWKCDALNAKSWRAAQRLGFTFEGTFRQHRIVKGHNRDTAWFAILDSEWPTRKQAFERWLAPENFDESGRQRLSLSALNSVDCG
jgi:RimJ/RimL family protein N-acetyltransferase